MHHKDRAMVFFQAGRVLCHILKAKIQTQRSTDEKVFKEFKLNCSSNAKHKDIFCQGLKNALSPLASGDLVALTGTNTSRNHHTFLHFLYSTFKITTKIARSPKHSTPNWHINWGLLPFFSFITWNTSTDLQSLALSEVLFYNHSRKAEDTLQHPAHHTQPFLSFFVPFNSNSRKEFHTALRMNNPVSNIAGNSHIWDKSRFQPDSCLNHMDSLILLNKSSPVQILDDSDNVLFNFTNLGHNTCLWKTSKVICRGLKISEV